MADGRPEGIALRAAAFRPCTALVHKTRRKIRPLSIRIAALVIPAIIVMDIAACASLLTAAGHGQTRRLAGQETNPPETLGGLACGDTKSHFDAVILARRFPFYRGHCLIFFLPGCVAPPDRDGGHKQYKSKHL